MVWGMQPVQRPGGSHVQSSILICGLPRWRPPLGRRIAAMQTLGSQPAAWPNMVANAWGLSTGLSQVLLSELRGATSLFSRLIMATVVGLAL